MPNRILRDGILTSERVDTLDAEEEVFYRRVMSVCDDYGRYHANPELLRAACYPLRIDKVTSAHVKQWLQACIEAKLIALHQSTKGQPILELVDFKQQIRAKRSKFDIVEQKTRSRR